MLLTIREKILNGLSTMRILIISDTHFGHINLSKKYQERPPDFEEKISRNWNRMATPDDMIIHLGDVFVGNPKSWQNIVSKLKGRKILVKGNHDEKSNNWYLSNGFSFVCDSFVWVKYGYSILFSHKPTPEGDFDINIHGHLHEGKHRDLPVDHRHFLISLEKNGYQPMLLKTIIKKWEQKTE